MNQNDEMFAHDAPRSFQRSLRRTDPSFYDVVELDDEEELEFGE